MESSFDAFGKYFLMSCESQAGILQADFSMWIPLVGLAAAKKRKRKKPMNINRNNGKQLLGKVALVTGGSRGIGAAIVRRLAADGADVAFSYVSSADKANALVQELRVRGSKSAA